MPLWMDRVSHLSCDYIGPIKDAKDLKISNGIHFILNINRLFLLKPATIMINFDIPGEPEKGTTFEIHSTECTSQI